MGYIRFQIRIRQKTGCFLLAEARFIIAGGMTIAFGSVMGDS